MKLHAEPKEQPKKWLSQDDRETIGRGIICLAFLLAIMFAYGFGQSSQQGKINDLHSDLTLQQWDTEDLLTVVARYTCNQGALAETPYVGFFNKWNAAYEPTNLLVVCEQGKTVDPVKFKQFVCSQPQAYVLNKSLYCRP